MKQRYILSSSKNSATKLVISRPNWFIRWFLSLTRGYKWVEIKKVDCEIEMEEPDGAIVLFSEKNDKPITVISKEDLKIIKDLAKDSQ